MIIVCDTREKTPLKFRKSKHLEGVERQTLKTGDYSIKGFEELVALERKNPLDLFGSLGKGHKRFKKELGRALEMDYFAIIIEAPFNVIRDKEFEGSYYSQMRGDVIIKILYTIKFKYGIDIIFCNGRKEASSIVRNLLFAWKNVMRGK